MNQALYLYIDGSVYTPSVLHYGAWAAKKINLPIQAWHLLDPHREHAELADLSGNIGPGEREELLEELVSVEEKKNKLARIQGETILATAADTLKNEGISNVSAKQLHGTLVDHVEAESKSASLIVIGKRGQAHGQARSHLGSNMERVIREASCPVLVAALEPRPVERFLLAYDGGKSSEKALDYVLNQPLLQGLSCHLVRVGHATPENQKEMDQARQRLEEKNFTVESQIIAGDPAQVFSVLVEKENIQLMVMGAYGHSRVRQFLVGSTTTEMIRSCHVPVLMFR
jgi:nucleotide-binding universal stress UspA family protein